MAKTTRKWPASAGEDDAAHGRAGRLFVRLPAALLLSGTQQPPQSHPPPQPNHPLTDRDRGERHRLGDLAEPRVRGEVPAVEMAVDVCYIRVEWLEQQRVCATVQMRPWWRRVYLKRRKPDTRKHVEPTITKYVSADCARISLAYASALLPGLLSSASAESTSASDCSRSAQLYKPSPRMSQSTAFQESTCTARSMRVRGMSVLGGYHPGRG